MAERRSDTTRLCPTRSNGAHSLIAQRITPASCFERQRRNYHKCFTCQYQGLGVSAILPAARPVPAPKRPALAREAPESGERPGRGPSGTDPEREGLFLG